MIGPMVDEAPVMPTEKSRSYPWSFMAGSRYCRSRLHPPPPFPTCRRRSPSRSRSRAPGRLSSSLPETGRSCRSGVVIPLEFIRLPAMMKKGMARRGRHPLPRSSCGGRRGEGWTPRSSRRGGMLRERDGHGHADDHEQEETADQGQGGHWCRPSWLARIRGLDPVR